MRNFRGDMLSEKNIIQALKAEFPEQIGDDAAVIYQTNQDCLLVAKDILVEDIHFRTSYVDPQSLAHKALHVNLSDIAAMGGVPQSILLGIAIPMSYQDYVHKFLSSFSQSCKNAGVYLIGGDTTQSASQLFISITVLGNSEKESIKFRKSAQEGDIICVAGNLGYAHIGLTAFERGLGGFEQFKKIFLQPYAKIAEGYWLGKSSAVHAMMDISDGFFVDLQRLCEASHSGAQIVFDEIQLNETYLEACEQLSLDPFAVMLAGGEDYGLLFTVAPEDYSILSNKFNAQFGYSLLKLGTITKDKRISFYENGLKKKLQIKTFSHFGEIIPTNQNIE